MKTETFFFTLNWTIKVLGSISMLILGSLAVLFLGVMLGNIEPNGSAIEDVMRFFLHQPLVMLTMLFFGLWATIIFWKRK